MLISGPNLPSISFGFKRLKGFLNLKLIWVASFRRSDSRERPSEGKSSGLLVPKCLKKNGQVTLKMNKISELVRFFLFG